MNFEPAEVAAACVEFGPQVEGVPPGLDAGRLLWALALNESSGGTDCGPRHEPAFDVGGESAGTEQMKALPAQFGQAAASSYGPLQAMFCNTPAGTRPPDFDDLATAMRLSVAFLSHELSRFKPRTLTSVGQIGNAGEPLREPSAGVQMYCRDLGRHYDDGLPATVRAGAGKA